MTVDLGLHNLLGSNRGPTCTASFTCLRIYAQTQSGAGVPAPCHPEFRLFLTSEPHEHFSTLLLQQSLKVTYEAPPGLKKNLLRTYETWSDEYIAAGTPLRARLLFVVAWLHAVLQERRTYIPQGWTKYYEFGSADLRSAADIVTVCPRVAAVGAVREEETETRHVKARSRGQGEGEDRQEYGRGTVDALGERGPCPPLGFQHTPRSSRYSRSTPAALKSPALGSALARRHPLPASLAACPTSSPVARGGRSACAGSGRRQRARRGGSGIDERWRQYHAAMGRASRAPRDSSLRGAYRRGTRRACARHVSAPLARRRSAPQLEWE